MTTYDYAQQPLNGWQERTIFRIAAWADHHPIPFLRGTDGLTWRQRQRLAADYLRAMTPTAEDRAQSQAWLKEWVERQEAGKASAHEEPKRRSA